MILAIARRVRRLSARVRSCFGARALILAYHRVAETDSDPWGLCVSPRNFAEHLDVLRERGPLFTVPELARRIEERSVPFGASAITFDDGYADNLLRAKPILDARGAPATFFVASGQLGAGEELWWDRLQLLLLEPGTLPRHLSLDVDGEHRDWDLGDDASYGEESYRRHRSWRAWQPPPTARHALYRTLWETLRVASAVSRRRALAELGAWAKVPETARPDHRTMTAEEVAALSCGAVYEIGAHTVTHPMLSRLSEREQHREIAESRAMLERLLGERVVSFSYPHSDRSPRTAAIVSQAGFTSAVTTDHGALSSGCSPLALPRATVADVDGEHFAAWLREAAA